MTAMSIFLAAMLAATSCHRQEYSPNDLHTNRQAARIAAGCLKWPPPIARDMANLLVPAKERAPYVLTLPNVRKVEVSPSGQCAVMPTADFASSLPYTPAMATSYVAGRGWERRTRYQLILLACRSRAGSRVFLAVVQGPRI